MNKAVRILMVLVLAVVALPLAMMPLHAQGTSTIVLVYNLEPSWTAPGGGGVFSAYVGPPDYDYASPGTTAMYNGREAGIIKAGLKPDPDDGHYWDEGLFAFKPNVTIDEFAAGEVTYDVVNQEGTNPVWITIEIDTGVVGDRSDNTTYQHVPTTNPAGWHTVDAAAGLWQKWNNNQGDTTGNPLISLSEVAAAHSGCNVVRAYLRLGMGDSYHGSGYGTVAWVDKVTLGGVTYDFVTPVWVKYSGNPVVTGSYVLDPCVIKDGSTYKMWYTHVDDSDHWTIYYADSSDGVNWSNQQQVLAPSGTPGAYDEVRVAGPSVINDGGTYKMWFGARDANAVWTIGYATSADGKNWTKVGKVLDVGAPGAWDSQMVREPWVIKDGSTYKMWYSGTAAWPVFKIGYATSSDGTTWTKHASNPIFTGTPGGWDAFQVYAPCVVLYGSTYHMYFSGTDDHMSQKWSTGHAMSNDGIVWTEDERNPILVPDGTDDSADYVSVMNDDGVWKMWYSYGGNYAIGLATLEESTQLWLDPTVASIPNDHSTTQTFTVRIANAVDLYGYQFVITFDKDNLECTAAAFDGSFFPTDPSKSSAPSGWNATIDNANGKVYFARTLLYPESPLSGSGPLATVTLRGKSGASAGSYKIDFAQNKLGDIDGNALTHTTKYAWLTLYGVGTLQGSVDLQGRTNESGGTVTIMSASGYLESKTITDPGGTWSFTNIPAGEYQVNIEMARYLDAQKGEYGGGVVVSPGGTTTLNKVKLLGGDANDDDVVDISDGTIIGGQFGLTPPTDPRADINNDGTVDILDLVLFGGNYTKTSPVDWL